MDQASPQQVAKRRDLRGTHDIRRREIQIHSYRHLEYGYMFAQLSLCFLAGAVKTCAGIAHAQESLLSCLAQ